MSHPGCLMTGSLFQCFFFFKLGRKCHPQQIPQTTKRDPFFIAPNGHDLKVLPGILAQPVCQNAPPTFSNWPLTHVGWPLVDLFQGNPSCPPKATLPRNKGLIAGLIKGNQWLISPDHKAGYFWGGYVRGGWLTSHDWKYMFQESTGWPSENEAPSSFVLLRNNLFAKKKRVPFIALQIYTWILQESEIWAP